MSSSLLGLNTALRGILAHQAALNTVGHNVANASTDGYSRQTVPLSAGTPISITGLGVIGTGVDTSAITRKRNQFLDFQFRAQTRQLGYFEEIRNTLRQVDAVFGEPSDTAMGGLMQTVFDSFQDVQNVPEDPAARTAAIEATENLSFLVRHTYDELVRMQQDLDVRVTNAVNTINSITDQIATLNAQAAGGAGSGAPANDILDHRDLLLDQLSKIVGTSVTYRSDGMVDVQINNLHVVSGIQTYNLSTTTNTTTTFLDIVYSPNSTTIVPTSGTLGGLLRARDTDIGSVATSTGILNRLNTYASNMIAEVNKIHRGGFGIEPSGAKNITDVTSVLGSSGAYTITSDGAGGLSATYTATGGSASAAVTGTITAGGTNNTLIPGVTLTGAAVFSGIADTTTITVTDGLAVSAGANADVTAAANANGAYTMTVNTGASTIDIVYTPVGGSASAAVTKAYTAGAANTNLITGLTITMDTAPNLTNAGVDYITTGNNFFDDIVQTTGLAARDIDVDSTLALDLNKVGASDGYYEEGNGGNARLIAGSGSNTLSGLGSVSFTEYHRSTIASLGSNTRASSIRTDNQEDFISLIQATRLSVSGVSIDEETANILRFQLAFQGSARVLTAIDEVLDLVVNRLGTVGR